MPMRLSFSEHSCWFLRSSVRRSPRQLSEAIAGSPYDSLAVPLAGGFTLVVVVASLGHLSGAHLNPAVTVGLVFNRRFPMKRVPGYLVAQLPGGHFGGTSRLASVR